MDTFCYILLQNNEGLALLYVEAFKNIKSVEPVWGTGHLCLWNEAYTL